MIRAQHHAAPSRAVAPRALLVGGLCGLGAVVAHASAAGGQVGVVTALLIGFAGLVLGPLLVRRTTLPRLVAATVGVQLLGHASMAFTMSSQSAVAGGGSGSHAHHGAHAEMAGMSHAGDPGLVAMLLDGGLPMLAGHLAIALATAVLARSCDRALVTLLREWLVAMLVPVLAVVAVPVDSVRRVAAVVRPLVSRVRGVAAGPRAPPGWLFLPAIPA